MYKIKSDFFRACFELNVGRINTMADFDNPMLDIGGFCQFVPPPEPSYSKGQEPAPEELTPSDVEKFTIMSPHEVRDVYKAAYEQFNAELNYYCEIYGKGSRFPQTASVRKLLLKVLVFCHRFNVSNREEVIQNLLQAHNKNDLKKRVQNALHRFDDIQEDRHWVENYGMKKRKNANFLLPDIFKRTGRVYLKTEMMSSEYLTTKKIFEWLKGVLPPEENLQMHVSIKEVEHKKAGGLVQKRKVHQYAFEYNKQSYKLGRLLKSIASQLDELASVFDLMSPEAFQAFQAFLKETTVYSKGGAAAFAAFRKKHNLPACTLNPFVFYQLKEARVQTQNQLCAQVEKLQNRYKNYFDLINDIQTKSPEENEQTQSGIDMIVLSIRPSDLSVISTYTDWNSCMTVKDMFFKDISNYIAGGAIVAYGVNSQNPYKRLSRILLKPYVEERQKFFRAFGEALFGTPQQKAGHNVLKGLLFGNKGHEPDISRRIYKSGKIYGSYCPDFYDIVDSFAKKYLNNPLTEGKVIPATDFYLDGLQKSYVLGQPMAIMPITEYLTKFKVPFKTLPDGRISVGRLDLTAIKTHQVVNPTGLVADSLIVSDEQLALVGAAGVETRELHVKNTGAVRFFPHRVQVSEVLDICDCAFVTLPDNLALKKIVADGSDLAFIPPTISVDDLSIQKTPISSLCGLHLDNLIAADSELKKLTACTVKKTLNLARTPIAIIDNYMQVENLNLFGCSNLTRVPAHIDVQKVLKISNTNISSLSGISVKKLYMENCPKMRKLDKSVQFEFLYAYKSALTELPENLTAQYVDVSHTAITAIPSGLKADWAVFNSTRVSEIPADIQVNELDLERTEVQVVPADIKVSCLTVSKSPVHTVHYSPHLTSIEYNTPPRCIHPALIAQGVCKSYGRALKFSGVRYAYHYKEDKIIQSALANNRKKVAALAALQLVLEQTPKGQAPVFEEETRSKMNAQTGDSISSVEICTGQRPISSCLDEYVRS